MKTAVWIAVVLFAVGMGSFFLGLNTPFIGGGESMMILGIRFLEGALLFIFAIMIKLFYDMMLKGKGTVLVVGIIIAIIFIIVWETMMGNLTSFLIH